MHFPRLKELRESKNLSLKQISEILSVSQTTYLNYELGKINVSISILIKLATCYNTSVDYMMGMTDDPIPHSRR